jgi:hypothetical protein
MYQIKSKQSKHSATELSERHFISGPHNCQAYRSKAIANGESYSSFANGKITLLILRYSYYNE